MASTQTLHNSLLDKRKKCQLDEAYIWSNHSVTSLKNGHISNKPVNYGSSLYWILQYKEELICNKVVYFSRGLANRGAAIRTKFEQNPGKSRVNTRRARQVWTLKLAIDQHIKSQITFVCGKYLYIHKSIAWLLITQN